MIEILDFLSFMLAVPLVIVGAFWAISGFDNQGHWQGCIAIAVAFCLMYFHEWVRANRLGK